MTTNVQAVMQNNFKVVVEKLDKQGNVIDSKEYPPGVHPVITYFHMEQDLRFREVKPD